MVPRESSCCCTEGLWVEMRANSSLMTWSRVLPSGGSTVQHVSLTLGFCYNKMMQFSIIIFNVFLTPNSPVMCYFILHYYYLRLHKPRNILTQSAATKLSCDLTRIKQRQNLLIQNIPSLAKTKTDVIYIQKVTATVALFPSHPPRCVGKPYG